MQILLSFIKSYENKENLFTLFSDGILFYKNLQISNFNLFPQNNFIWNEDLGMFSNSSNPIPYSIMDLVHLLTIQTILEYYAILPKKKSEIIPLKILLENKFNGD